MATLPGARLFHEGQFEGRKVRLPVFLARRPAEPVDQGLQAFYGDLLAAINTSVFRDGDWTLCARSGWPDNSTFQNLVAWTWQKGTNRHLIVTNLSDSTIQARIQIPWQDGRGETWRLRDILSGVTYDREGTEMLDPGLYVELGPWDFNFFRCGRLQSIIEPEKVESIEAGKTAALVTKPSAGQKLVA
jgi:hypothetical protein